MYLFIISPIYNVYTAMWDYFLVWHDHVVKVTIETSGCIMNATFLIPW